MDPRRAPSSIPPRLRRLLGVAIALVGLATAPLASAQNGAPGADPQLALLAVDLDTGRIVAEREGLRTESWVDAEWLQSSLQSLIEAFERGEPATDLRTSLGDSLLAAHAAVLREAERWQIHSTRPIPAPGPLAPLATLDLPWDPGRSVIERYAVAHVWPRVPEGEHLRTRAADRSGGILIVAPFRAGTDPAEDDPDTLRTALRGSVADVQLLPRDVHEPGALAAALGEAHPAVTWIRSTPDQLAPLAPAFGGLGAFVAWTLPSRARGARAGVSPTTFAADGAVPAAVLVQSWAVPEEESGPILRDFTDGLASGRNLEQALTRACRLAAGRSVPASVWGSLAVVGQSDMGVPLKRASWLRRWLSRR